MQIRHLATNQIYKYTYTCSEASTLNIMTLIRRALKQLTPKENTIINNQ